MNFVIKFDGYNKQSENNLLDFRIFRKLKEFFFFFYKFTFLFQLSIKVDIIYSWQSQLQQDNY